MGLLRAPHPPDGTIQPVPDSTDSPPRRGPDTAEAGTRWDLVALAVGAGILAGLQVGKVPPSLPILRAELGLDLVTAGLVASTFNAMGALLGITFGLVADRFGARLTLLSSAALLGLGSLWGGLAPGAGALLASRLLEGFGFIGLTVAAPKMIVAVARRRDLGLAVGIWANYMPAGMAASMLAAPLLLAQVGWRGLWFANAVVIALYILALAWGTRPARWSAPASGRARFDRAAWGAAFARPGLWLYGACFGLYTIQWFAITAWLPTFLIETEGHSVAAAATIAAIVVAANMLGNFAAAWLMHRGVRRWLLVAIAFIGIAVAAFGVFSNLTGTASKIPFAFAFSILGGLLPASVLAGTAAHAPSPGQVAMASGFAVQGANLGGVIGPPLMAVLVGALGGWSETWWLMVVAGGVGLVLVARLRVVERRG
jgi:MFS family permease